MIIVATTSLPAVELPDADRWNAARSCQNQFDINENPQNMSEILVRNQFAINENQQNISEILMKYQ